MFLEGDEYFDSPLEEYKCAHKPSKEVELKSENNLFPCRVYDKNGNLIRVEYPKSKSIGGKKWVGWFFKA